VSVAGEMTEMIGRVLGIRSELRSNIGRGIANGEFYFGPPGLTFLAPPPYIRARAS
jgi:hypothetical protein